MTKEPIWFKIILAGSMLSPQSLGLRTKGLVKGGAISLQASLPKAISKGGRMMSRRGEMRRIWFVSVMLLLTSLSLAGCTGVKIVDRAPVSLDALSLNEVRVPVDEHDLAVLAIDFDPPLEYEQIMVKGEQATLLVAVENIGLQTESDVKVKARLSVHEDDAPILEKTCLIDAIAPGQIKIARFRGISRIPYRQAYDLKVWVLPVLGEVGKANNEKGYDLYINMPQ